MIFGKNVKNKPAIDYSFNVALDVSWSIVYDIKKQELLKNLMKYISNVTLL